VLFAHLCDLTSPLALSCRQNRGACNRFASQKNLLPGKQFNSDKKPGIFCNEMPGFCALAISDSQSVAFFRHFPLQQMRQMWLNTGARGFADTPGSLGNSRERQEFLGWRVSFDASSGVCS